MSDLSALDKTHVSPPVVRDTSDSTHAIRYFQTEFHETGTLQLTNAMAKGNHGYKVRKYLPHTGAYCALLLEKMKHLQQKLLVADQEVTPGDVTDAMEALKSAHCALASLLEAQSYDSKQSETDSAYAFMVMCPRTCSGGDLLGTLSNYCVNLKLVPVESETQNKCFSINCTLKEGVRDMDMFKCIVVRCGVFPFLKNE